MDHFPEGEVYCSAQCDNITELSHLVVGPEHGQVEASEDGDTIDGEVGWWDEEAYKRWDYDGDEPNRLLAKGHHWIGHWYRMGQ